MTKVILQTDNAWTRKKIESAIDSERILLQRALRKTEDKVKAFEQKYGNLDRASLYGKIDDMELLEWEGESEVSQKLKEQLASFQKSRAGIGAAVPPRIHRLEHRIKKIHCGFVGRIKRPSSLADLFAHIQFYSIEEFPTYHN